MGYQVLSQLWRMQETTIGTAKTQRHRDTHHTHASMADTQARASTGANTKPIQVKLVLLGEAAVGKSSLVSRFVNNEFHENKEPTIGAAFLTRKCKLEDRLIKFEIWDTAGQERFHSLAPMYYRNAQAALVVYDITKAVSNPPTLEPAPKGCWHTRGEASEEVQSPVARDARSTKRRGHHHILVLCILFFAISTISLPAAPWLERYGVKRDRFCPRGCVQHPLLDI